MTAPAAPDIFGDPLARPAPARRKGGPGGGNGRAKAAPPAFDLDAYMAAEVAAGRHSDRPSGFCSRCGERSHAWAAYGRSGHLCHNCGCSGDCNRADCRAKEQRQEAVA